MFNCIYCVKYVLVNCIEMRYNNGTIREVYTLILRNREGIKMPERKNSEARIRANNKYAAKAYDRINIAVPKGRKAELQAHAERRGESLNCFIGRAIEEQLTRDNEA